jgi:hypothetical protein
MSGPRSLLPSVTNVGAPDRGERDASESVQLWLRSPHHQTLRESAQIGPTLLLRWDLSLPDDLMGLGLDVPRVAAVHEHFQRVQCG